MITVLAIIAGPTLIAPAAAESATSTDKTGTPVQQPQPYESEGVEAPSLDSAYLKATTLENLQTAFNGESNARAKYLAFAERADKEGYGQVASLFRATARAEEIHAQNHAEVIAILGATPVSEITAPEVRSTKENLEAAIAGETGESTLMYPSMISRARTDRDRQAIRSFNFALTAEQGHAQLYQTALDNLESWKTGTRDFFVCNVCGYTVTEITFKKCPSCFIGKEEYVKVS